jgi:hypothetical protein
MSGRTRIVAYGSAGLLIVAGGACALLLSGVVGGITSIALIGLGLIAIVGLVFFEVGLSEDHDRATELERRAREQERRARLQERAEREREREARPLSGARTRLDRMRGRHRRLR